MLHLTCCLTVLWALSGAGPGVCDEPKTADEVIDAHIAAIGGREKLAARRSMRITGKSTLPMGQEGTTVLELKRPNKLRGEMTIPNVPTVTQAFDGQTAWMTMPFGGGAPQKVPPEMTGHFSEGADMDGPLVDYRQKGHTVELVGREDCDGRPAYKLKVVHKGAPEGEVDYHFIDAERFLVIKIRGTRFALGRSYEYERLFSDYRAVDGLLIAHETRQRETSSKTESVTRYERVELNVDLPDERFSFEVASRSAPAAKKPVPAARIQNDPAARELYDGMIAAMRSARTLQWESRYTANLVGIPNPPCTYKIWLQKPNQFRLEATAAGKTSPNGILVGDGERLWIWWPDGCPSFSFSDGASPAEVPGPGSKDVYMTHATPLARHSIGHEVSRLGSGMIMTILDPSTFHGYTDSLQQYIDAVAAHGEEAVDGMACDKIEVSIMDGQRSWEIWIARQDKLPRRLRETVRVSTELVITEDWSNVKVDGGIAPELFAWKPPDGWREYREPELESQLLAAGSVAPDFEAKLADGGMTKLSDHRGKIVWLFFWRVG